MPEARPMPAMKAKVKDVVNPKNVAVKRRSLEVEGG